MILCSRSLFHVFISVERWYLCLTAVRKKCNPDHQSLCRGLLHELLQMCSLKSLCCHLLLKKFYWLPGSYSQMWDCFDLKFLTWATVPKAVFMSLMFRWYSVPKKNLSKSVMKILCKSTCDTTHWKKWAVSVLNYELHTCGKCWFGRHFFWSETFHAVDTIVFRDPSMLYTTMSINSRRQELVIRTSLYPYIYIHI